ncbi:unnamed protein product [Lupinus luteus]|uniref:Protein kinase domain-containing protein n=1 Tax=Lupinus luteus TaxID=3873 RepID=A0AAV1WA41_LUPLU
MNHQLHSPSPSFLHFYFSFFNSSFISLQIQLQSLKFIFGRSNPFHSFKSLRIQLHSSKSPQIQLCSLKSAVIIVEYNAKLSDFGLAKDGPEGDKTHVSTRVMGTYGYAAPDYVMTGFPYLHIGVGLGENQLARSTTINRTAIHHFVMDSWGRPTTSSTITITCNLLARVKQCVF